ncbi:MAG: glycosyltransferase family 2 protein [Candidatus Acidiferrales bacterium]|jgi:poly-beta-1,6-N-acetyl-D-glucosamine synthase
MLTPPSYVLITPARNEAEFLELTIKSVVAQTLRPVKWIIVSDGSTDGTNEIVRKYTAAHPWIELVEMPEREERHFAGKALAVNTGYKKLVETPYDVIGNLDADVSFEPDYFAFLMDRFAENAELGVAGTAFHEGNLSYNYEFVGVEHVSGMCQMFRRECFDAIGGYPAIKSGGIDLIAVLSARAKGWETRTFVEKKFIHHRIQSGALHTGLRGRFYMGRKDYLLGNHPMWEIFRSVYQMGHKPYFIGGFLVLFAYMWDSLRGVKRTIPEELMALRRSDQMKRLKLVMQRRLGPIARLS